MPDLPTNILITRTDRIGDVILSLPVAGAIKSAHAASRVTFLVSRYAAPIPRMCPWVDDVLCLEDAPDLKSHHFDAAICLYPRPDIATTLKHARIPIRIGTARRWYSYRFNRRINTSRAAGGRHERDFNLDLLIQGLREPDLQELDPRCIPPQEARETARIIFGECGVDPETQTCIVVHPGCGGSARNWTPDTYQDLCRRLASGGIRVLVSGSETEQETVKHIVGENVSGVTSIAGRASLPVLAAILSQVSAFIGPSTGPMHLAAAVGTPVVALFGPVRTTGPDRWGPLGSNHRVLMPNLPPCGCRVDRCELGDCMANIEPNTVIEVLKAVLEGRETEFDFGSRVIEFRRN